MEDDLMECKNIAKEYNNLFGLINASYHKAALKMNLTDSELSILYVLSIHSNKCNQSVIYKESGLIKSTVNSAIKKMEKNGILCLTKGTGRNTCVFPTEKGKLLIKNTADEIIKLENKIYDSWSKEEQDMFMRLNKDFAEKFNKIIEEM